MGKGYRHGSEELSYGLQIVGGTTRPKNPTQGMVWANTPNEITHVYLADVKPSNPVAGGLWVKIGDSGNKKIVSPVSKEWITVYPLSAEQYIGGEWMLIEAISYQDGAWVEWITYLYNAGNEFEAITGGWIGDTRTYTGNSGTAPIITRGNTRITAKHSQTQKTGTFRTRKAVDLTGVKSITVTGEFYNATGSDGNVSLNIWSNIGNSYPEHRVATVQVPMQTKVQELTVFVGDLPSGSYYVGFIIYSGATASGSGADTSVGMDSCIMLR